MAAQRRWSELSRTQQTRIVVLGTVEVILTAVALVDLARRPAEQVRGRKALWAMGVFVQPVGPVAYLVLGRRRAVR
ncbi:MAG: PLD nuclease N-terminal domain-containing protein [Actinomycetes bacterium]